MRTELLAAAGILVGGLAVAPSAAADAIVPIGPNQYFQGIVNGARTDAVIKVVCPGPATPGQVGHPAAGQTLSVGQGPISSPNVGGYTGSAATSIVATLGANSSTAAIIFDTYNTTRPIPTSILLPCSGPGTVVFRPSPTSDTARPDFVPVTYFNIAL
jgi:hypothetical protein